MCLLFLPMCSPIRNTKQIQSLLLCQRSMILVNDSQMHHAHSDPNTNDRRNTGNIGKHIDLEHF